jgi:hypothetical protein
VDIKKLVVGQEVWMQSGDQFQAATVEEVAEDYVWVALHNENFGYNFGYGTDFSRYHGRLDFRHDGSQCGLWEWVDAWDPRPFCGPNSVPFRLTDNHSAAEAFTQKREAFVERYCKKHGFTTETMTRKQVLEMREEEGWENPF